MRACLVVVALVGCGKKQPTSTSSGSAQAASSSGVAAGSGSGSAASGTAPVSAPVPVGPVRFVAVQDKTARVIEIDATTAKVVTTAKLSQPPVKVVWVGEHPVVMFSASSLRDEDDPKLDGRAGAITRSGFSPLAALPSSTWAIPKPKDATNLGANWNLQGTSTGETWQGRCEWGGIEDGGHCDEWVWARLGGGFTLTSRMPPPEPDGYDWTDAAPAPGYKVTFAPIDDSEYHSTITCAGGGSTLTLPNEERPEAWDKDSGVRWVSTDPPVFVADQIIEGYMASLHEVVFEGCSWSNKLDDAKLYAGPSNTLVIANATTMSVRRGGKELASLAGADLVAFAQPDLDKTSPFAVLERELAGDVSMLLPDATVLAPTPTPATGAHLFPGAIERARIVGYHVQAIGDASSLAAEIEITTDGPARTYRTVQLIDATGHVLVASSTPVKPLARVAAAPTISQPTQAGPLVAFLAAPRSAANALAGHPMVFGTDANEHGMGEAEAKTLLESWSKLALQLDPAVREVRTATYGYAIASVSLAKPGGAPYRMIALVVGHLGKDKTWKIVALHYLPL